MKPRGIPLVTFVATASMAFSLVTSPAASAAPVAVRPAHQAIVARVQTSSYIVQAQDLAAARAAVRGVGGRVTHELGIINAVGAQLTVAQADALRADPRLTLTADAKSKVAGTAAAQPYVVRQTEANRLHAAGITGAGVTIAFVDTGIWTALKVTTNSAGVNVYLQGYDAIRNTTGPGQPTDANGHGTNVVSIAASGYLSPDGTYIGIAPDAARVVVKAFDANGAGTYADTIRGLNWILANRARYNIRVLNLSFGATPQSFYWNDPLAQAVMKLWQAGVVVVASAGNWGPYAQSITVPGNVPYVITVGAMTDNYTPADAADDRLASFSSTGPTYEGFVKPELVAPGGHVTGLMNKTSTLPTKYPQFLDVNSYFYMSGTSQSAAVVSGVVALMLQAQPTLTPDQVKCKLMSSARPALDGAGKLAYTVFQQGAGQVDAYDAVYAQDTTCANHGLDVAADLGGTQHYGGPAHQQADGTFYVVDAAGQPINQQGYLWNNGYLWNQGYLWNNGYLWNQGYIWNNGYLWNQGFVPSTASYSGIESWVNQE